LSGNGFGFFSPVMPTEVYSKEKIRSKYPRLDYTVCHATSTPIFIHYFCFADQIDEIYRSSIMTHDPNCWFTSSIIVVLKEEVFQIKS
jgi:hypothetical protein